jgi:hypothetical protein
MVRASVWLRSSRIFIFAHTLTQSASASFCWWSPPQKKKSRKQNSFSTAAASGEEPLWLHLFLVAIHIWRDYQLHCWAVLRSPCASYLFVCALDICGGGGAMCRVHFYLFELLLGLSRLWSIATSTMQSCLDFCANTSTVDIQIGGTWAFCCATVVCVFRDLFLHHSGYFVLFTIAKSRHTALISGALSADLF